MFAEEVFSLLPWFAVLEHRYDMFEHLHTSHVSEETRESVIVKIM
jgi:hypothetical protein